MIQISYIRVGLIVVAFCANDYGEITTAKGLTCDRARRRLILKVAG